jgi:MFS family permease
MVYYRRNLLVLSMTCFLVVCCFTQVVPFFPLFIKELGVKSGLAFWAGLMAATQTIAVIVTMPYWGKLANLSGFDLPGDVLLRDFMAGATVTWVDWHICRADSGFNYYGCRQYTEE